MRKLLCFVSVLLCILCLFVSCSSDVGETALGGMCSALFKTRDDSKGLSADLNNMLTLSSTDSFYWQYQAIKKDSLGKSGETSGKTNINGSNKGLAKINNLSVGTWDFCLYAYLDNECTKLVYKGRLDNVVLSADEVNSIEMELDRVQTSGVKGTLLIDPAKVQVGTVLGGEAASVVTPISGTDYVDDKTDSKILGNLSDYSYTVYMCKDFHYDETKDAVILAGNRTSVYSKEYESGTYYLKFKLSKDNDAVSYVGTLEVEIYDWCTTAITEGSGISVKYLKEFKIDYKDEGNVAFTGTHQKIDNGDGTFSEYPQAHQYGRAEELDEPTRTGYAFVGYYTEPECTNKITCVLPYVYTDTVLYAKWDSIEYSSINWVDNFPALSIAKEQVKHTGGSTSGIVGTTFTMPTSPTCVGYNFTGWYTEADVKITSVPQPTKHNEEVTYTAKWEPISYTIKFDINAQGKAFAITKNENVTLTAEYNLEDMVYDLESETMGFLGWSTESDWKKGSEKIIGLDGYVKNLTTTDKSTVTLYAIWSDYFVPLEYIRSFPSAQQTGPYIDTGLNNSGVERIKMSVELAGEPKNSTQEILCGSYYYDVASGCGEHGLTVTLPSPNGVRGDKWTLNGNDYGSCAKGGIVFEDEIYELEIYNGQKSRSLTMNGEVVASLEHARKAISNNLYLFGFNSNMGVDWLTDMRLYSCRMYDGSGDVIRKFVPCKLQSAVPNTRSSDGVVHSTIGEIGLWDLKTNQFYPNKMTGTVFHEPCEEVKVTLYANNEGTEQKERRQLVISGVSEKLHKNIFSKNNSTFLGWGKTPDAKVNEKANREIGIFTENTEYYARWSVPVSWNLFGQVAWVQSTVLGGQYVDTGVKMDYFVDGGSSFRVRCATMSPSPDIRSIIVSSYTGNMSAKTANSFAIELSTLADAGWALGRFRLATIGSKGLKSSYSTYVVTTGTTYAATVRYDNTTGDVYADLEDESGVRGNESIVFRACNYQGLPEHTIMVFNDVRGFNANTCSGVTRLFGMTYTIGEDTICDFVPAVLAVDLGDDKIIDSSGKPVVGTSKVYAAGGGQRECKKGDVGFWDLKADLFYPVDYVGGTPEANKVPLEYPKDEFLVRLDANGGLGTMADQTYRFDETNRLSENRFKRDGYEFVGWADLPDGTDTKAKWYSDTRVFHPDELRNVTLFAQWRKVKDNKPYVELNYIRNDTEGNAYINTGYKLGGDYGSFRYLIGYRHTLSASSYVLGATNASNCRTGVIGLSTISAGLNSNNTVKTYAISQSVGTVYDADFQSYGNSVDYDLGTTSVIGAEKPYKWSATGNFGLFTALSTDGKPNQTGKGDEIYYFKLYDDKEKLVRDMIPVMLTEDIAGSYDSQGKARYKGTLGMWDKCNNKFYSNANTTGYFVNDDIVSIVFDANGGSGSMDTQSFVANGSKIKLNSNQYKGANEARLIGWNTKADGSGIWYSDEYETTEWPKGTFTLYAQWENKLGDIDIGYFEPVNYVIKNTANKNAFIDTLYKANVNTQVKADFYVDSASPVSYPVVFGARTSNHSSDSFFLQIRGGTLQAEVANNVWMSSGISVFGFHSVIMSHSKLVVDGVERTASSAAVDGACSMYVFGCNDVSGQIASQPGWNTEKYFGKISGFSISEGSVVLKHFVPCRLTKKITSYVAGRIAADSSVHKVGEVGFWDLVSNKFYSNAGTGDFTCELN